MMAEQKPNSTRAIFGASTEGVSEEHISELEIRFAGITPEDLLTADIDAGDKELVAAIQIGNILLNGHDSNDLSSWIRCKQQITGDYSYDNI